MRALYLLLYFLGLTTLLFSLDPSLNFCADEGFLKCQSVLTSSYANILGIPLSFGLMIFGLLGFLRAKHKDLSLLVLNGIGILGVIYSVVVMGFILKNFCVLCSLADVLIILVFILGFRRPNFTLGTGLKKDMALALLMASLSWGVIYLHSHPRNQIESHKVVLLSSPLILGNPEASKEIVVFTDYQCPACKKGSDLIKDILSKADVKVVIKNYPLSSRCNNGVSGDLHPWACEAAKASYCANEQGRFQEFYDIIYSVQDQIKKAEDMLVLLETGSFDMEELRACLSSDVALDFIKADIIEGNGLHVQGTPTFYFQGQKVPNWNNPYLWQGLLELK